MMSLINLHFSFKVYLQNIRLIAIAFNSKFAKEGTKGYEYNTEYMKIDLCFYHISINLLFGNQYLRTFCNCLLLLFKVILNGYGALLLVVSYYTEIRLMRCDAFQKINLKFASNEYEKRLLRLDFVVHFE